MFYLQINALVLMLMCVGNGKNSCNLFLTQPQRAQEKLMHTWILLEELKWCYNIISAQAKTLCHLMADEGLPGLAHIMI
jgi:hypothetical protein